MVLYENGLIRLDYDAAADMLTVVGPDLQEHALMRVYEASGVIVEAIGHYNIKRLLIDSSQAVVDVSQEDYRVVVNQFTRELLKTQLQKVVRLASGGSGAESALEWVRGRAKRAIAFQSFTSRDAALDWLRGVGNTAQPPLPPVLSGSHND